MQHSSSSDSSLSRRIYFSARHSNKILITMLRSLVLVTTFIGLTLTTSPDVIPEPRSGCSFTHSFTGVGQQAYLQSPNWPSTYPHNSNCQYSLASPVGTKISVDCDEVNVEYNSGCTYDRMTISLSGDNSLHDGLIICGQGAFQRTTQGNSLFVQFTSDSSNAQSPSLYRFQCILSVVDDGQNYVQQPVVSEQPSGGLADTSCSCGTRNEATRIVGGSDAITNEFPWRVALYSTKLGVFCGGTIISPNWVMTAAHCTRALTGEPMYIDAGDHDLTISTEAQNEIIQCQQIIEHPYYNSKTQDNDMALCRLERPLVYSRAIQPGCLPWTLSTWGNGQDKHILASGWGTLTSGGGASPILQKVELPVKTTEECRAYYGTAITDNMFCTYAVGKDTCQGDSGGSVDFRDPYTGRYFAVGVVSWGVGCAGVNQPGVYVKMSNYLDWIQSVTAGETFCR